jgi:hypothetical protein
MPSGIYVQGNAGAIRSLPQSEVAASLAAASLAALAEAEDELEQMHRHYYGNCPGGCPACVAIYKALAAIAKATAE